MRKIVFFIFMLMSQGKVIGADCKNIAIDEWCSNPIILEKKTYTVVYKGVQNRTVNSFKIIDKKNNALFSWGDPTTEVQLMKDSDNEINVFKLRGKDGEGLIIYYSFYPTTDKAHPFCQVLGMINGRLAPFSNIMKMDQGSFDGNEGKHGEIQLLDGDIITGTAWPWHSYFGIIVPMKVDFLRGTVKPAVNSGLFKVWYDPGQLLPPSEPYDEELQIYPQPDDKTEPQRIIGRDIKTIKILGSHAGIIVRDEREYSTIVPEKVFLKVKVNNIEGYISDKFRVLGLHSLD